MTLMERKMAGRIRNIEVTLVSFDGFTMKYGTQQFTDWWDFADFLKQNELKGVATTIKGWRYVDFRQ